MEVIMKYGSIAGFIILIGLAPVNLVADSALDMVTHRLGDVERAIDTCDREISFGYTASKYSMERLELERDILMLFLMNYEMFLTVDKLERKIDLFLRNIRQDCVRDCFSRYLSEKREMEDKIVDELDALKQHHRNSSVRSAASDMIKHLEREIANTDMQLRRKLGDAMIKNIKKFKCN